MSNPSPFPPFREIVDAVIQTADFSSTLTNEFAIGFDYEFAIGFDHEFVIGFDHEFVIGFGYEFVIGFDYGSIIAFSTAPFLLGSRFAYRPPLGSPRWGSCPSRGLRGCALPLPTSMFRLRST